MIRRRALAFPDQFLEFDTRIADIPETLPRILLQAPLQQTPNLTRDGIRERAPVRFPLEDRDARQIIREIKGFPVLEGVRGQPGADLDALEGMVLQVSEFVSSHPEVAELDLNPVIAYPDGAIAVDARVVLAEA